MTVFLQLFSEVAWKKFPGGLWKLNRSGVRERTLNFPHVLWDADHAKRSLSRGDLKTWGNAESGGIYLETAYRRASGLGCGLDQAGN